MAGPAGPVTDCARAIDLALRPYEEARAEVTENYRATAGFSLTALQRGSSLMEDPYLL